MPAYSDVGQPRVASVEVDGKRYTVSVRIIYDGIEHVGRLWFSEEGQDAQAGMPDRGPLSGRSKEEIVALAKHLATDDLERRFRRAQSEKRRFLSLRQATDEILAKIRYLNQLALTMRAGLIDMEGAASEVELTERQLHQLIDSLRGIAGVEG
ncbi:MAG: hypothetical protein NVS1B4_19290 [Gemmatimonadaceae bacterium]